MPRHQRKRRNSKNSPATSPDLAITKKKQRQSDVESLVEQSEQSESDYYLDAEDDEDVSVSMDRSSEKTMNDTTDTTISPSQSILPSSQQDLGTHMASAIPFMPQMPQMVHTSTPVSYQQMPSIPQITQIPQLSQLPQMPCSNFVLSDQDIQRIVTQLDSMLDDKINKLIKEKVERATTDLQRSVTVLQGENRQLKDTINVLESKIDDLEQYSRRSCLRIAGIEETSQEKTDDIVLGLASRLDIDIKAEDLDRSHRVGSLRTAAASSSRKPREIIVKFRHHQARLNFLKGRAKLRENKEKIFINEDLTQLRQTLFYECRNLKHAKRIQNTWVYNGFVFIAERDGTKVKISRVSDLDKYKAS